MARKRRPASRRGTARRAALGSLAVVAAAVGLALALTLPTPASRYRTAVAAKASVAKTVALTGTVEPVHRVTLAFGVDGTVATVAVHVGEHVTAGQTLATLTTTSLVQQVDQAEAALRAAQAAVVADETRQAAPSTPPSGGPGGPGGPSGPSGPSGPGVTPGPTRTTPGTPTTTALAAAQHAVVSAQKTADAAEQTASAALATADTDCGTPPASTASTASAASKGSGASGGAPTGSTTTTTTTTTTPGGSGSSTACAAALHGALGAQQTVATDQKAVTTAEAALAKLLAQGGSGGAGGPGSSSSGSGTRSAAHTSTGTSAPAPPSRRGATHSGTVPALSAAAGTTAVTPTTATGPASGAATPSTPKVEASQLASDQSTVDSDNATLIVAQQSLAEADLTTPISGTVGAVYVAHGDTTTAGAATTAVTILTQRAFEAEGLVTPAQVPGLAVGDTVDVAVDGRPSPIAGRVTRVGPVDVTLGDQYPVLVALPGGIRRLFTGSLCQMTVVVHVARHTLAVPTSAVHTAGGRPYVTVLRDGRAQRRPVAVGIVGVRRTQILAGLRLGAQVVLATLARPLPTPRGGTPAPAHSGFSGFSGFPPPIPGGRVVIIGGNGNGNGGSITFTPGP